MNATDPSEKELEPVIEGPGKRLRDIRIKKSIDLTRVASLLHLNAALLESLEADDYSKLHGAVFVQGYLRNYARLLDTPVAPILEAFEQFRPVEEEQTNLKVTKIKHEVRSSHAVIRLMTWLIIIGLIALVAIWWRGYLQWPLSLGLPGGDVALEQPMGSPSSVEVVPQGVDGQMSLPPIQTEGAEISVAAGPESPEVAEATGPISSGVTLAEGRPPEEEVDQAPVVDVPAVEAEADSEVTSEAGSGTALAVTQLAVETSVQISFSGESWVDIKDASGGFRLIGNKGAGEQYRLGGEPPYRMVLGNASAVTILVNGKAYDLAPYIRGNVARLTLKPE